MKHPKHRTNSAQVLRSGTYEVDLAVGELRRNGVKIPLQEQPFKVVARLLAQPGAPVTREEQQAEIWGAHPMVDTDLGLNTAVRKLRAAFRDPADNPRFIETLPKQGYRFIAPVWQEDIELLRAPLATPVSIAQDGAGRPEANRHSEVPAEGVAATGPDREISMSRSSDAQPSRCGRPIWLCARLLLVSVAGLVATSSRMIGQSTSAAAAAVPGIVKFYPANAQPVRSDGGIGGYDLSSRGDLAFAFDYDHSGKLDHLVFYRPGTGIIWILQHLGGHFRPVYEGGGIGNYSLNFGGADRAFAFDYDHNGKLDYLVFYRQGVGVLKNEGRGIFTPVYQVASEDRASSSADHPPALADQVIPFDYDHSGKPDHLLFYRSGWGIAGIWTNIGGRLSPVRMRDVRSLGQPLPALATEQAFAFDYEHSGKLDHLLLYRPGAGMASILENTHGAFHPVYQGQGIAGYDLMSIHDRALAFDFVGSGKLDHLAFYRPGTGIARIVQLR